MSTGLGRTGSDAWVKSTAASANFRDTPRLQILNPGTDTRFGYIFFKNPAPKGATVLSATLHLFSDGFTAGSPAMSVQRLSSSWGASRINWNNRPSATGSAVTVTQADTDGADWAFDVTAQIQTLCDGTANYGWRISTTATAVHRFYSLNSGDNRPFLEVEWADAPDAPTELSPAAGSAVSIAKPVLSFNFHDVSGNTQMAACQVQINPTNVFTSPAFDSGTVSTNDPELDLSTTAYAGISVAATAWWRVRVQDGSGVWSDWSDSTSFTRTSKGTLTINSPTGGVVNDATQEILWTLSGVTQTGWRITVWDDSDPSVTLHDTGRRSGTAAAYTLPAGVIKHETTTYRLRVRVWDTLNRATTPGDKSHTEAVTTFVFNEGAGVAVTGLTAAQQNNGLPHVQLDWQRATAPDGFTVVRNGEFVAVDLDPADLLVSGTSYRYVDKSSPPGDVLTYKVRSKVSGALTPGAAVSVSYLLPDVWLADFDTPQSSRLVPVQVNLSDCTFNMPEVSGSYQPVDGDAPVLSVQGQQGLAGTIVGRIRGLLSGAITADDAVTDLLWFKAHPENQLRLTIGNQNLRVVIHNVTTEPIATGVVTERKVSFDFLSLDGPTQ